MTWYVGRHGERCGPFDDETLGAMIACGEVEPTDLVWRPGIEGWVAALTVPGLFTPPPLDGAQSEEQSTLRPAPVAPAAAQEPRQPQASSEPKTRNYFRRHWDGDLTLPVSYWINGLLVSLGILGMTAATNSMNWTEGPKLAAGAAVAVVLFALGATVWQLVGIWRSAEMHVGRGGSQVWATLAKVAVVLGVLRTGVDVSTTIVPMVGGFTDIMTGDKNMGTYELRVLRDASELEVAGAMSFGLTNEVEKVLNAHPTIGLVHLNSGGGRVEEAKKLGRLITSRGLSTYTASECSSACTLAYAGGKNRLLHKNGKLGFHQFSFPGLDADGRTAAQEKAKEYLADRGVKKWFTDKAFLEPSDSMWYPTQEELLSAGVVLAAASEEQVALSGIRDSDMAVLEQELLKVDMYSALKEFEPATYQSILTKIRNGVQRGRTMTDVREEVMPDMQAVYMAKLPYGSDGAVIAIAHVMIYQLRELQAKGGTLCTDYLSQDAARSRRANIALSLEARLKEGAAAGELIRTASNGQYGPKPGAAFDQEIDRLVGGLYEKWGQDVALIGQYEDMSLDQAKVCEITIEMLERLAAYPQRQAGQLLRTMFAGAG